MVIAISTFRPNSQLFLALLEDLSHVGKSLPAKNNCETSFIPRINLGNCVSGSSLRSFLTLIK